MHGSSFLRSDADDTTSGHLTVTEGIITEYIDVATQGNRTIQALATRNTIGSSGGYGDLHLNHYGGNVYMAGDDFSFTTSGVGTTNGSWRAPIFYDSNNTAYYMDPAGDSHGGDYYNHDGWFRNYSNRGLYNQDYQGHFYQPGDNYWHLTSKSTATYGALVLYGAYNATHGNSTNRKGYLYWDANGFGLLNSGGSWWLNNTSNNNNYLCIGGTSTQNAYNSNVGQKLMFGGADTDAQGNYYIGTNSENYGGSYSKLDLRWHTGIRMGAQAQYGGVRIFDSEDMGTKLFSVGETDTHVRITNNLYVPIVYDSNNSAYYVDPASTSRVNAIEADGFNAADMGDFITFYGDNSAHHGIAARDNAGNNADDLRINSYGSVYINLDSNNNNTSGADFKIGRHGGGTGSISQLGLLQVFGDSLYVSTDYSFRAPIFYDINNTNYYIDGNSTSVLNQVQVNYLGVGTAPNTSYRINMNGGIDMNAGNIDYVNQLHFNDNVRFYDDGNSQYLNFKYGSLSSGGFKILDGNNDINGYILSNGLGGFGLQDKDAHWFIFTNGTSETQIRANNNAELYVYTSYVYAPGSFRSFIFYDSSNTAYYTNHDGTSVFNQINVTTLNTTSDKRFKSDLVKIDNAVDRVKAINGYTYMLDGNDDRKGGLIAQEVEEVLPEAVKGDDYKKLLDYNATIALLVEAVKEQQEQIDALKKQLNS